MKKNWGNSCAILISRLQHFVSYCPSFLSCNCKIKILLQLNFPLVLERKLFSSTKFINFAVVFSVFAIRLSIGRRRAEAAKLESRKEKEGEWRQQHQCINFFYYSLVMIQLPSSSSITKFVKRFLPPLPSQNAHKMLLPSLVVNTKKFLQQGEISASSKNYLLWVQTH